MINVKEIKLQQIQVIRAFAALFVLASHTQFIAVGANGVDIFFCISGFIMSHITVTGYNGFFYKRIARVIPLYWIMTLFVSLVTLSFPSLLHSTDFNVKWILFSLFFIPFDKNGYVEPMLGPGWTLNYEMFFYVVYYISMKLSFSNKFIISSLILCSLVFVGIVFDCDNVVFKFYTSTILLEFIFGMLSYHIYARFISCSKSLDVDKVFLIRFVSILTSVFLLYFMFSCDFEIDYQLRFLYWGVPSFFIFLLSLLFFNDINWPGFIVNIGNSSYSIYLIHLFLLLGFDRVVYNLSEFDIYSCIIFILLVCIVCIVSFYSWKYIEKPLNRIILNFFEKNKDSQIF